MNSQLTSSPTPATNRKKPGVAFWATVVVVVVLPGLIKLARRAMTE